MAINTKDNIPKENQLLNSNIILSLLSKEHQKNIIWPPAINKIKTANSSNLSDFTIYLLSKKI